MVVYERVAAGVGFSQRLFELHTTLLASALELVLIVAAVMAAPLVLGRQEKSDRKPNL